ncbi:hypothetical protein [Bacteroides eggerthii]|uniref:hypothetical protein n=1 Tax=Bacteroides eggerthii TaxID=28111 RepID=UPI00189E0811|nr:hypothetical protein [Bacteroides eggerthii]
MARQKNDGKGRLGGRQKGTPNRATSDLRKWVEGLINENKKQIREDLRNVEPIERLKITEKLLSYILPKKKEISVQEETEALLSNIDKLSNEQLDKLEQMILNVIQNGTNERS